MANVRTEIRERTEKCAEELALEEDRGIENIQQEAREEDARRVDVWNTEDAVDRRIGLGKKTD